MGRFFAVAVSFSYACFSHFHSRSVSKRSKSFPAIRSLVGSRQLLLDQASSSPSERVKLVLENRALTQFLCSTRIPIAGMRALLRAEIQMQVCTPFLYTQSSNVLETTSSAWLGAVLVECQRMVSLCMKVLKTAVRSDCGRVLISLFLVSWSLAAPRPR